VLFPIDINHWKKHAADQQDGIEIKEHRPGRGRQQALVQSMRIWESSTSALRADGKHGGQLAPLEKKSIEAK
jgi:hypothetical protein